MRYAWLLLLGLACCSRTEPAPAPAVLAGEPRLCRTGPDGARPVAERGIGGTGAPAVRTVERGIGGTGIIGVITGFASVCVAGQEVALPDGVPARMDESSARLDDLRAGQVVAVDAAGEPGALRAERIAVRHEVVGPVEAVGPGTLTVAGQLVLATGAMGTATGAKLGAWVAVSGLRAGSTITATRIDPAPPGHVVVRGELIRIYGASRIGSLPVMLPPDNSLPAGWPVTVTGRLVGGVLVAESAMRDLASDSPSAFFGPTFSSFIVEGTVSVLAGGYLVDREFVSGSGFGDAGFRGRAVASFTRRDGGLVATGLQVGGVGVGEGSRGGFTPVPAFPVGKTGRGALGGSAPFGRPGSGGFNGSGFGAPPGTVGGVGPAGLNPGGGSPAVLSPGGGLGRR